MTEQEFLAALGARVRVLRAARGITQREVADAAGIHRTVIGRIEQGRVNFGVDFVRRLAHALGTTPPTLMPRIDPPPETDPLPADLFQPDSDPSRTP
jgi:transcriptional regulator with XRE-family HTH domain